MKKSVSIVMPVFNEERFIFRAVTSLLETIPESIEYELLIVDGGSNDNTLSQIQALIDQYEGICLLKNDKRTTPSSLNIGIKNASHEIILRADGHAFYKPRYVELSLQGLLGELGDNVGGVIVSKPNLTAFSHVLAVVMNSWVGSGRARYRQTKSDAFRDVQGGLVDSVWCGCWYKSTLLNAGLFDEEWVTNQDVELNQRLKAMGYKVYLDPRIQAELIVRPNMMRFLHQYFRYGSGRCMTTFRYPRSFGLRQSLPLLGFFLCVVALLLSPVKFLQLLLMSIFLVPLYFLVFDDEPLDVPKLHLMWCAPIILGMNIAWACGFIVRFCCLLIEEKFTLKF